MNSLGPIFITALIAFYSTMANADHIALEKTDFSNAKETHTNGETIILAELNPSGRKKLDRLGKEKQGHEIKVAVAGEVYRFKIRDSIREGKLQMGPFEYDSARKIVGEINRGK